MAQNKHLLISIVMITMLATASPLTYKDCGSIYGKIRSVAVSGCENSSTCILPSGKSATLTVQFSALEDADSLRAIVKGIIGGIPVPFPLPQADACKNSGLTCPIQNGQNFTYSASIPIRPSYPKIKVLVKWELQDSRGKDLFCIEIPAAIM